MDRETSKLAERWDFSPLEELPGGHCSRVYADQPRVLKVPFQGEELTSGFWASLALSGTVGPQVFESDSESAAILMERMVPGTKLIDSDLTDLEQLNVAAEFMFAIRGQDTENCIPLAEYVRDSDPLARQLLDSTEREVFLHGDLHQENILLHGDSWRLIDPKGLVGDPAYEPAAFIRNPIGSIHAMPNLNSVMKNRVHGFSEKLGLNPWGVCAWSLIDLRSFDDSKWQPIVKIMEKLERDLR